MPQATTITIDDREDTPVSHVFTPAGVNKDGVWRFINKSVEETIGRESITTRVTRGVRNRVRHVITVPVMATETINGVDSPVVIRTGYVNIEFVTEPTASQQERENLAGLAANLLAVSQTATNTVNIDVEEYY